MHQLSAQGGISAHGTVGEVERLGVKAVLVELPARTSAYPAAAALHPQLKEERVSQGDTEDTARR